MTEVIANGQVPRVVLLARAGKAAEQLADALRQAGAEMLLAVDPANTGEDALRALNPQAILVALEPSIEPALDRLDGLLSDPALTVIFDEADVAAHRAGWDAARWVRHLSAKLRNDSNVLPPGTESDQDPQSSPGRIAAPAAADADLSAFTREAVALADSVPVDGTPTEPPPSLSRVDSLPLDAALLEAIPAAQTIAPVPPPLPTPPVVPALSLEPMAPPAPVAEPVLPRSFERPSQDDISLDAFPAEHAPVASAPETFDGMAIESVSLDDMSLDSLSLESMSLDSVQLDSAELDAVQLDGVQLDGIPLDMPRDSSADVAPMRFDDDAFFLEELSATRPLQTEGGDASIGFDIDFASGLTFDVDDDAPAASGPPPLPPVREPEEVLSFEELVARSVAAASAPPPDAAPAPEPAAKSAFSLDDLSLAPVDDAPADAPVAAAPRAPTGGHDLSALEARISSLSLVDIEENAAPRAGSPFAVATGVVLVEAGLGGPDPARQLLSAIPAEFPAVVLVRLHLQGGRYDRLVAQMERASALPVALAEAGGIASPGTIYFLPEGIGLSARGNGFGFIADPAPAASLFAALPPGDSAVVFLSGSDPQLIDTAMAAAATGTLLVAQSPDDCYDGTACAELRRRGATSGLPAELAGRLASRWPS